MAARQKLWSLYLVFIFVSVVNSSKRPSLTDLFRRKATFFIEFYKFETCDNASWNQLSISGFKLSHSARAFRGYNVDVYFKSDLKTIKEFSIAMRQCKESVSYNTCENYGIWRYSISPCAEVSNEKAIWAGILKSVTPPFRCPFTAGTTYQFRNFSLDVSTIPDMSLDGMLNSDIWEWRISVINEKNKNFTCTLLQFKNVAAGRRNKALEI